MTQQFVQTENRTQFTPAVKPDLSPGNEDRSMMEGQPLDDHPAREIYTTGRSQGGSPPDRRMGEKPHHGKNILDYLKVRPQLKVGSPNGTHTQGTTHWDREFQRKSSHEYGTHLSRTDTFFGKNRSLPPLNLTWPGGSNVIQRENGAPRPLILEPTFGVLAGSVEPPRNAPVRDWLDQNTERIRSQLSSRDTLFRTVRREVTGAVELPDEEIEQAISQWATEEGVQLLAVDVIPSLRPAPEMRPSAVAIRSWLEGNFLEIGRLSVTEMIVHLRRNVSEALEMRDSELSRIIADWLSNRPLQAEEEGFSLSDLVRIENSYITVVIPQRIRVRLPVRFRDLTLFTFQFQATPSSLSMSLEFNVSHHMSLSISGSLADYVPSISPGEEDEESPYRPRVAGGITLSSRRRVTSADTISRLRALYTAGREFQEQMRTLMGQSGESRETERADVERITSTTEEALRPREEEPETPPQPETEPSRSEHWADYHITDFAEDVYGVLSPLLDMYNAVEEYNEGEETPVWSIRAFAGAVTEEFRESAGVYGGIELILHF